MCLGKTWEFQQAKGRDGRVHDQCCLSGSREEQYYHDSSTYVVACLGSESAENNECQRSSVALIAPRLEPKDDPLFMTAATHTHVKSDPTDCGMEQKNLDTGPVHGLAAQHTLEPTCACVCELLSRFAVDVCR